MFTQAAWSIGDLKSLSKGTSHIVTFSWDRGAQIEDEWRMMGADENAFDAERAGLRNVSPQLVWLCMHKHTNEHSNLAALFYTEDRQVGQHKVRYRPQSLYSVYE